MTTDRTHPDALITDPQNCLRVAAHEELDIPPTRLLQEILFHRVFIRVRQVQALAPPEQVRVVRDGVALRRRVYDRDELLEVPAEQRVVEHPVLVLHALQERVLANRAVARTQLVVRP